MKEIIFIIILLLQFFDGIGQGALQLVSLGEFRLENGQSIKNCQIGIRTFGKPNADTSNVIVLLPWYSGKSEHFAFAVGSEGVADSTKYFVIIIDPFGDGISSSPSNSKGQSGSNFPEFTVHDMVEAQQALLTKKLGIQHVFAIMGYSMGGMECFDWAVSYPNFMDKVVPICGSPKPAPYSRLFYQTMLTAIEGGMHDSLGAVKARQMIGLLFALHVRSVGYVQQLTTDSTFYKFQNGWMNGFSNANLYDFAWQMKAILTHDATRDKEVKSLPPMLIVVNKNDRDVYPDTCYEFAKSTGSELYELTSDFGHMSFFAEFEVIVQRVRQFLEK